MRRILLNLSLLALVAAPLAAHAASTDLLTLTETSGGTNIYTFLLPTSPTSVTLLDADSFTILVPTTTNGVASLDTVAFADLTDGGGLYDLTSKIGVFTPVLFTGSLSAPTFVPSSGTLAIGYDSELDSNLVFNYSLVPTAAASATPEPSSLALLGTGALGLFGAFRRRFVA